MGLMSTVGLSIDDADVSCVVVVDDMTGDKHGCCAFAIEGDPTAALLGMSYVHGVGTPVAETGMSGPMIHCSRDRGCGCESYAEKGPDASDAMFKFDFTYSGKPDLMVFVCIACGIVDDDSPATDTTDAFESRDDAMGDEHCASMRVVGERDAILVEGSTYSGPMELRSAFVSVGVHIAIGLRCTTLSCTRYQVRVSVPYLGVCSSTDLLFCLPHVP